MNIIFQDETSSELEQVNVLIQQHKTMLQILEKRSSYLQSKQSDSGGCISEGLAMAPSKSILDEIDKIEIKLPYLEYRGKKSLKSSATEAYVAFFEQLVKDFAREKLDDVASALAAMGRSREPFGRDRSKLYSSKDKDWAEQHSRCLAGGWLLDVNLDPPSMLKKIRVAAGVCDLVEGRDYSISLPSKNSK